MEPSDVLGAIARQMVGDPELVDGSFVDQEMRQTQCDRLYRIRLRGGGQAFVYCLIEHKSAPDGKVALRLSRYLVRAWEWLERDAEGKGLLAPIFPLVVYHGRQPWRVPLRFSAILEALDEVRNHLLDFPFGLLDLGGEGGDHELSQERELRADLVVLKYSLLLTEENVEEIVHRVMGQVRGASDELLMLVVRYMITAYGPPSWSRFESAMRRP
jgi:hypothetical protein